jgi:hypothetical protein
MSETWSGGLLFRLLMDEQIFETASPAGRAGAEIPTARFFWLSACSVKVATTGWGKLERENARAGAWLQLSCNYIVFAGVDIFPRLEQWKNITQV